MDDATHAARELATYVEGWIDGLPGKHTGESSLSPIVYRVAGWQMDALRKRVRELREKLGCHE